MNQEVILDFLNLPGIAGVALMGRRSRPYFCGIDQTLNFQQKEALTQGILQVFETIPDEFESFEFHFGGHQVYIYKLDHEIILLVLTQNNLVYSDYLNTIRNLKTSLKEDIVNGIATFRLFAGSATLPGIKITQRTSAFDSPSTLSSQPISQPNSSYHPASTITPGASPDFTTATDNGSIPPPPASSTQASLADAIAAMNHLSSFTTQYLGIHVIANYWKTTRPDQDWLTQLQIDRAAQISLIKANPQQLQAPLTSEQQTWLRSWVASFIKRCSLVIRDFPTLIDKKALDSAEKKLLLGITKDMSSEDEG